MSVELKSATLELKYSAEDIRSGLGDDQWALYDLIPSKVGYVMHPTFEAGDAEDKYFGAAADQLSADWTDGEGAGDVADPLSPDRAKLTRKQEVWLFRRYNYARYRLALLVKAQQRRLSLGRARQMVKWFQLSLDGYSDLINVETLSQLTSEELDLYGSIPETVECMMHPSFEASATEATLFGEDVAEPQIDTWRQAMEVPERAPAPSARHAILTREEEVHLFLRLNYARYRLGLLADAQERRVSVARARQMAFWFRRVLKVRSDLVNANMALVLALVKQKRTTNVELAELVAEGNATMLRCVDKFDVSYGFKFSSYASTAIFKRFSRLAGQSAKYRTHFPTEFRPELEQSDYDTKKHEWQLDYSVELLREILTANRAELTDREQTIIQSRFPFSGGKKRTVADVADSLGITKERVRQLQNKALGKIRAVMETEHTVA